MLPNHEQRENLKRLAGQVATELLADLIAGKMPALGIDGIRAALRTHAGCPRDPDHFDELEKLTTHKIVQRSIDAGKRAARKQI